MATRLTSKTVAQLARSKIPVRSAHDLVEGFEAEVTIADKGYDADPLRDSLTKTGAQIVIPPKRNRKVQRPYDADLYKERNRIERFFAKLKQFRRVATRYDKLLISFMGFVKLAAIAIWLKQLNHHHALVASRLIPDG